MGRWEGCVYHNLFCFCRVYSIDVLNLKGVLSNELYT